VGVGATALAVLGLSLLMGVASLLVPLARRLRMPFTVLMGALGVGIGLLLVSAPSGEAAPIWSEALVQALAGLRLPPDAMLTLFLPPLLFAAGLSINIRRLMDDLAPVIVLAVIAVLVCTAVVGVAVGLVSALPVTVCLLIGAVVATTDSAAVLAVFKEVGAPRRLSIIVEGESLFNDAAAIAIFTVLVALLVDPGPPNWWAAGASFLIDLLGGAAAGFILARIFVLFIGMLEEAPMAEITLTIALAYLSYVISGAFLGVSGVTAVVVAAMVMAAAGRSRLSAGVWERLIETWRLLDFLAVAFIFVLAAMLVPAEFPDDPLAWAPVVLPIVGALIAGTLAARIMVLFFMMPGLSLFRMSQPIPWTYKTVLVWGGLRGAVTLALAIAVAETPGAGEDVRQIVLLSAAGYVLFTLIIQAPSLRPLMRLLGLGLLTEREEMVRDRAMALSRRRVRDRLREIAVDFDLAGAVAGAERREGLDTCDEDVAGSARVDALPAEDRLELGLYGIGAREGDLYLQFLMNGIVTRRVAEGLRAENGRMLDALRTEGPEGYREAARSMCDVGRGLRRAVALHRRLGWTGPLAAALAERFESLVTLKLILRRLDRFVWDNLSPLTGEETAKILCAFLSERRQIVAQALEAFDLQYPDYAAALRTQFLERVALAFEESEYADLLSQSLITGDIHEDLQDRRRARLRALAKRPKLDLGLRLTRMMARVPLFQDVPEAELKALGRALTPRVALPGQTIIEKGGSGTSMFFIAAGEVEVVLPRAGVFLQPGDFFGEMALIDKAPRSADVRAVGFVHLLELSARDFRRFAERHPQLKARIRRTAEDRRKENLGE